MRRNVFPLIKDDTTKKTENKNKITTLCTECFAYCASSNENLMATFLCAEVAAMRIKGRAARDKMMMNLNSSRYAF